VDNPILDLRGGTTLWEAGLASGHSSELKNSISTDVAIIGSGITGSFLAERLSCLGLSIVVVDRNQPQMASTAASTALLLWEIDTPLRELADLIGLDKATAIYRACQSEVSDILALIAELGIACHAAPRPSLYLAGNKMGAADLADEARIREQANLPSRLVTGPELHHSFGFRRDAALYSQGGAEADPVLLARGLAQAASRRGTKFFTPVAVTDYDLSSAKATILTDGGHEIGAKWLILANGYEMPPFVPATIHKVSSTWVVASQPGIGNIWPQNALAWEAADPYLYMRFTADQRIIIGGADEDILDASERDRKIPEKTRNLLGQFQDTRVVPVSARPDYSWAGFFGTTSDGLPLIGRLPGHRNVFAAFGYGGNGITFSALAARLITDLIAAATTSPLLESMAIDR
jgi:glycine/D-amino acid oxidase-like deaminating enzyme